MQDFNAPRNQTAPAPPAPPPGFTPEMQRGLTMAIVRAKPNCCETCDKLQTLQELLFDGIEAGGPLTPAPTMNAAGERSEAPPLQRPDWGSPVPGGPDDRVAADAVRH